MEQETKKKSAKRRSKTKIDMLFYQSNLRGRHYRSELRFFEHFFSSSFFFCVFLNSQPAFCALPPLPARNSQAGKAFLVEYGKHYVLQVLVLSVKRQNFPQLSIFAPASAVHAMCLDGCSASEWVTTPCRVKRFRVSTSLVVDPDRRCSLAKRKISRSAASVPDTCAW